MRVVGLKPSALMIDFRLAVEPRVACKRVSSSVASASSECSLSAVSTSRVAAAEQCDGQVEVVVGVVRVGRNYLLEEWSGVLALAALGHALIVHHLGQRQAAGDKGEGRRRLRGLGGVEARQPAV